MVQYKEIGVVSAILVFMVSIVANINTYVNDEGVVIDEGYIPYACDKETVQDMYCYKLSKVGTTGVNRNCYYDRERGKKYKVCTTGWERIQEIPKECPVQDCDDSKCQEGQKACPYVVPCEICQEPVVCPKSSGGGGGGNYCPTCPSCTPDGKTVCTETIGFVLIEGQDPYYCRNCGINGCDACMSNEDIELDLDMTLYVSP